MMYANGSQVMLGDVVALGNDEGVVVCCIDGDQHDSLRQSDVWNALKTGVVVEFKKYGSIHFPEYEGNLRLLRRAQTATWVLPAFALRPLP